MKAKKVLVFKWDFDRFGCDQWNMIGEGLVIAETESAAKVKMKDSVLWLHKSFYRLEDVEEYESNSN